MTQKMLNELQRSVSDFVQTLIPSPRDGEAYSNYCARLDSSSDYHRTLIYDYLSGRLCPCKHATVADFDLMYRYACSLLISVKQAKTDFLRYSAEGENNKKEL